MKLLPDGPALATYTRPPWTAMLTGRTPPEETTPPGTSASEPSRPIRSTETWLLPADGDQEPAVLGDLDRALRGEPGAGPGPARRERGSGLGVSAPSACRSKAPIVLAPFVLSLT